MLPKEVLYLTKFNGGTAACLGFSATEVVSSSVSHDAGARHLVAQSYGGVSLKLSESSEGPPCILNVMIPAN